MLKAEEDTRAPACKVSRHHTRFIFFSYLVIQPPSTGQTAGSCLPGIHQTGVKAVSTRTQLHLVQLMAGGSCCPLAAPAWTLQPTTQCQMLARRWQEASWEQTRWWHFSSQLKHSQVTQTCQRRKLIQPVLENREYTMLQRNTTRALHNSGILTVLFHIRFPPPWQQEREKKELLRSTEVGC